MIMVWQICLLPLLHRNYTDCISFLLRISVDIDFVFLSVYISCICDLEYSCIRLELWLTCLSIWTKHVLFITAKLSSKYSLLCSTRCSHFSVNHQVNSKTKMKLKLTLIYPAFCWKWTQQSVLLLLLLLQRWRYLVFNIIYLCIMFMQRLCNYIIENVL